MNKLSFTYASDKEHNLAQRLVIKTIENLTGKKKLEKLYNNSLNEKINPRVIVAINLSFIFILSYLIINYI